MPGISGQLGEGGLNSLTKPLCYIETGVFSEVNVVGNKVPPSGRTLDRTGH